jgi:hypothetical protein
LTQDISIRLAVVCAALRMARDDILRTRIGDHFCADIAGVRTGSSGVAVLATYLKRACRSTLYHLGQKGRRRAQYRIYRRGRMSFQKGIDLRQIRARPVHFPITCGQFTSHVAPFLQRR